MSNLKMKIRIGAFEIEIEGEPAEVTSRLNDLQTDGISKIYSQLSPLVFREPQDTKDLSRKLSLPDPNTTDGGKLIDKVDNSPEEELSLEAIATLELPKSEKEWILVYGYKTDPTINGFSRDDLRAKYVETKRMTPSASKNFAKSIKSCVNEHWILPIADGKFKVTPDGKEQYKKILVRVTKDVSRDGSDKGKKTQKIGSKPKETYSIDKQLNLFPDGKQSVVDYYNSLLPGGGTGLESNLVFVNYLRNIIETSPVGLDKIFTCYQAPGLKLRIPTALKQSLLDTSKKGWLDVSNIADIEVAVPGINYLKTLPVSNDKS